MKNKHKKALIITMAIQTVTLIIAGVISYNWTYAVFVLLHYFSFLAIRSNIGLLVFGVFNLSLMVFGYFYYGSIWAAAMPAIASFICTSVVFIISSIDYVKHGKVSK